MKTRKTSDFHYKSVFLKTSYNYRVCYDIIGIVLVVETFGRPKISFPTSVGACTKHARSDGKENQPCALVRTCVECTLSDYKETVIPAPNQNVHICDRSDCREEKHSHGQNPPRL